MIRSLLCLILILFSLSAQSAQVQVYFFELRDTDNSLLSFEKDGKFWHVAMKYGDRILEAHPFYGVRLTDSFQDMGALASHVILEVPLSEAEISERVQSELGKKFHLKSEWNDLNTTQCSKLIAKILGLRPTILINGKETFSPDSLFLKLQEIKSNPPKNCRRIFID